MLYFEIYLQIRTKWEKEKKPPPLLNYLSILLAGSGVYRSHWCMLTMFTSLLTATHLNTFALQFRRCHSFPGYFLETRRYRQCFLFSFIVLLDSSQVCYHKLLLSSFLVMILSNRSPAQVRMYCYTAFVLENEQRITGVLLQILF